MLTKCQSLMLESNKKSDKDTHVFKCAERRISLYMKAVTYNSASPEHLHQIIQSNCKKHCNKCREPLQGQPPKKGVTHHAE